MARKPPKNPKEEEVPPSGGRAGMELPPVSLHARQSARDDNNARIMLPPLGGENSKSDDSSTGPPKFSKFDAGLPGVAVGAPAGAGPLDANPENPSEPEVIERSVEAPAASTPPRAVHRAGGSLKTGPSSVSGSAEVGAALSSALGSPSRPSEVAASTGLFVNRELDRIEVSGSNIVRTSAARMPVDASRSKLEAVQRELEGLRGSDEQTAPGDNRQEAPLSQETLDTIRHTVASTIILHDAPLLSRAHVGILERIAEFLRNLKVLLDELSGVAGSLTTLAGKVGAAYLALKELCDMLLSALGGA